MIATRTGVVLIVDGKKGTMINEIGQGNCWFSAEKKLSTTVLLDFVDGSVTVSMSVGQVKEAEDYRQKLIGKGNLNI